MDDKIPDMKMKSIFSTILGITNRRSINSIDMKLNHYKDG